MVLFFTAVVLSIVVSVTVRFPFRSLPAFVPQITVRLTFERVVLSVDTHRVRETASPYKDSARLIVKVEHEPPIASLFLPLLPLPLEPSLPGHASRAVMRQPSCKFVLRCRS